jgi:hypothetical protein
MKTGLLVIIGIVVSFVIAEPTFNGTAPGCSDNTGCHTFNDSDVSVIPLGNLQVQVTLAGVQAGEKVAGELVDVNGTVVTVEGPTTNNPFILTATTPGRYVVNAGYKKPSRHWDSLSVDIGVTAIDQAHELAGLTKGFELFQNHPNPFNPTTVIRYHIPRTSQVKVEVYDLFGRKIYSLVKAEESAGDHSISFDGSNLASGVYLYRVKANGYVATQKMIITK